MFALVKNETVTNPNTQETSEVEVIKLFAPYTLWEDKNGTQYSPDSLLSLTALQKQDLGIYDVAYAPRPDDRFFSVTENAPSFDQTLKIVKITFSSTAKQLEDEGTGNDKVLGLKSEWISQIKQTANNLLSATDWMLVRKIERNVDIPAATATYRAAVMTEANRLEAAITAATNIESFRTVVTTQNWPTAD
jgi:hypothetical protein